MLVIMADASRFDAIREDLAALRAPGYSALPVIEGGGRTGVHAGDRIHPGGLVALFVVEPDASADALFEQMVRRRDAAEDPVTRFFLLPVEREA
jgi:hypothetical protein